MRVCRFARTDPDHVCDRRSSGQCRDEQRAIGRSRHAAHSAPGARPDEDRPFSFNDLERAVEGGHAHMREAGRASIDTAALMGAVLGASARQVVRLRTGALTVWQADYWAVRAGLHPAIVWPEWFSDERK